MDGDGWRRVDRRVPVPASLTVNLYAPVFCCRDGFFFSVCLTTICSPTLSTLSRLVAVEPCDDRCRRGGAACAGRPPLGSAPDSSENCAETVEAWTVEAWTVEAWTEVRQK